MRGDKFGQGANKGQNGLDFRTLQSFVTKLTMGQQKL
jgi:hypothetical protein